MLIVGDNMLRRSAAMYSKTINPQQRDKWSAKKENLFNEVLCPQRAPTHQIQIYNQYGQFVRKFGANILQHPRGVCVDNKGRIIVVECKVRNQTNPQCFFLLED